MLYIDQIKVLTYINANEDLKKLFTYYINNCISLTNPYHNANHIFAMMYHICCIYEKSQNDNYEFKLDNEGLYILLISAIFHDFNHSAGRYDDNTNVNIAIDVMKNYIDKEYINDITSGNKMKEIIEDNINATCYPYTIEDKDLNLYQRILRECDILVSFSSDYFTQCACGLKDEMRIQDWNKFFGEHIKFLMESWKDMKLSYSKKIIEENKVSLLEEVELLFNIMNK